MRKQFSPVIIIVFFMMVFAGLVGVRGAEKSNPERVAKPKALASPETVLVKQYLSSMSLDEKLGQLFFSRVPATTQVQDIENYHLGGYILFGRDIEGQTLASLKATLDGYQSVSTVPLLIGSDEEGGTVTRVSQLLEEPFQSPQTLYLNAGLSGVLADTKDKVQLLKSLGIHTGLFPVADIAQNQSSFIYDRTLGADLETTKTYISKVVKLLKNEQFGSILKHFPGYGDNGDSHLAIIYDNRSLSELEEYDLQTFKVGIESGADSILVSHNIVTALDNVPSSISSKVSQMLREDYGFEGVIMTDDLDMAGLADFTNQEEAAFKVIEAGNDMIISSQYALQIPYLKAKVEAGELSENRVNQSVERILRWKYRLGLLK